MRPNLFLARVLYGNSNNIVNFASRVINQRNLQSMNNQFSPKISEVLIYSKEEALRLHNECVAPEHLLLGLIRDGEGKAIQILRLLNLDFRSVKLRAEQSIQGSAMQEMPDADHEIILNEKASKIMRLCLLEARMLKAQVADTEHILLAIMKEKDNNACRILEENSIHYTDILNLLTQKAEKSDVQSGFGFPDEDEEDPDMDILKQCQKWHEESKQHKIIDALEAIPAQERTPEMDSELARAYNNLAVPEDRELYQKALSLLKPHADYFAEDYRWNFRMGYSYYYLDQEGRALPYFHKALEKLPGDEDTQKLIDACESLITLPQFTACFRERTEDWWETFAEMEAELRQMMDDDKNHTRGAELVAQMEDTLNLVFDEISFEMGFNGEKYELILTPEGDKVKLFELVYFQKHAPKEVLEHWNILVGRQPIRNIGLRTDDGWDISGEDVQIWLEEQGEHSFAISAYCEKLLPMLCLLYTSPSPRD
mgnify:CR=1 FL=1